MSDIKLTKTELAVIHKQHDVLANAQNADYSTRADVAKEMLALFTARGFDNPAAAKVPEKKLKEGAEPGAYEFAASICNAFWGEHDKRKRSNEMIYIRGCAKVGEFQKAIGSSNSITDGERARCLRDVLTKYKSSNGKMGGTAAEAVAQWRKDMDKKTEEADDAATKRHRQRNNFKVQRDAAIEVIASRLTPNTAHGGFVGDPMENLKADLSKLLDKYEPAWNKSTHPQDTKGKTVRQSPAAVEAAQQTTAKAGRKPAAKPKDNGKAKKPAQPTPDVAALQEALGEDAFAGVLSMIAKAVSK